MRNLSSVFNILPDKLSQLIKNHKCIQIAEEIRLRVYQKAEIVANKKFYQIDFTVSSDDIINIMQKAFHYSLYAHDKELSNGFITLNGGHRMGFSGQATYKQNVLISLGNFNSLNIRLARQVKNADINILPNLIEQDEFQSSLIISPPGVGKTTLLRELTKNLSEGSSYNRSYKVSLIDERNEISSCVDGVSQMDVGARTDIFYMIDKSDGINMAIRSMSPEIIVTDEIGTDNDVSSIKKALLSGVKILASAHGASFEDVFRKMPQIISLNAFENYIVIHRVDNIIYPLQIHTHSSEVTYG